METAGDIQKKRQENRSTFSKIEALNDGERRMISLAEGEITFSRIAYDNDQRRQLKIYFRRQYI